jgi:hypothetical protein
MDKAEQYNSSSGEILYHAGKWRGMASGWQAFSNLFQCLLRIWVTSSSECVALNPPPISDCREVNGAATSNQHFHKAPIKKRPHRMPTRQRARKTRQHQKSQNHSYRRRLCTWITFQRLPVHHQQWYRDKIMKTWPALEIDLKYLRLQAEYRRTVIDGFENYAWNIFRLVYWQLFFIFHAMTFHQLMIISNQMSPVPR